MKLRSLAYLLAVLLLFTEGCRKKSDIEEQRYLWSTEAPLTIPYRIRLQRFEKENLLRNSSFETGRLYKLDSLKTTFAIDGWQQTGEHVQWVDIRTDSLFNADEACSGHRAVKIQRTSALETDLQGEGISSDYVKVIPGNYSLSLFARMENIVPNRSRLGIKMFDCIEISLRYYDRNKNLIRPAIKYPHENQVIDGSFKSLSLANYSSVEKLGWCRIIGKSDAFPFPDGDIPTDAHFVKLFIGLKGTGTLWIDSVSFKYTDRNFSAAERMQQYTDTAFHISDMVIPTPKMLSRMESVIYSNKGMKASEQPVIVYSDESLKEEAEIVRKALKANIPGDGGGIEMVSGNASPDQVMQSRLLISMGKTSIYDRFIDKLPIDEIKGKPEGYFIFSPAESPNIVILGANSASGLQNAVSTVVQLIDRTRPVFHNSRIIDYPDYDSRYFTLKEGFNDRTVDDQRQFINDLKKYKLNGSIELDSGNAETSKSYQDIEMTAKGSGDMVFYTGSSYYSINTDLADLNRFILSANRRPVFFDNSMLMATSWADYNGSYPFYPGKARLFNLFEPFGNTGIQELYNSLDTSFFVINLPPSSEIEVIRLATAADFLWNMKTYSKDYSLWKVLVSRYGRETARNLVLYADKYSLLLETLLKTETNIQPAKNIKQGQLTITELTGITAKISDRLGQQHKLIKELLRLNAELRNRLNRTSLRGT